MIFVLLALLGAVLAMAGIYALPKGKEWIALVAYILYIIALLYADRES
jgi:hypothetical protein